MNLKISKTSLLKGSLFILGVVVTLLLTKFWNTIYPEEPIIIKEVTDSVRVVHEYQIPDKGDSLTSVLSRRLENLKLLNEYEHEINTRIKRIKSENEKLLIPNLIKPDLSEEYEFKGYMRGDASPYFELECPNLNDSKYIDFHMKFFNKNILKEIKFLRVSIFKFKNVKDKNSRVYIMDEFYDINIDNQNFIRFENLLGKGKFELLIGFTLKKDIQKDYPDFYYKRCIVYKN